VSLSNEEADGYFERFLADLNRHGVCQADFMVDPQTGRPYLIDVNPRFWGGLAQAVAAGVDFPYLVYRMAVDGDIKPVRDFRTEVVTRWLGGDVGTFLPLLRMVKHKMAFLKEFARTGKNVDLYDYVGSGIFMPFLTWLGVTAYNMIRYRTADWPASDALERIWK